MILPIHLGFPVLNIGYTDCQILARYVELRSAGCHYAECHGATKLTIKKLLDKLQSSSR